MKSMLKERPTKNPFALLSKCEIATPNMAQMADKVVLDEVSKLTKKEFPSPRESSYKVNDKALKAPKATTEVSKRKKPAKKRE